MRKKPTTQGQQAPEKVKKHWNTLRADYVNAAPRQRLKPIVDRLEDRYHWGPNLLVTSISAVEGFARALVLELLAGAMKRSKRRVYEDVRDRNGPQLVEQYLCLRGLGKPAEVFTAARWDSYGEAATKYRHLLVHECTYLNAGKLEELNRACREVLEQLVDLSGHRASFDRLVASSRQLYEGVSPAR